MSPGRAARVRLGASEKLPLNCGGPKIQTDEEIATHLWFAIDDFGPHVNATGDRRDAELIVLLPREPAFHAGTVETDIQSDRSFQDRSEIGGQEAERYFSPVTPFHSTFHVRRFGLWHKYPQLKC